MATIQKSDVMSAITIYLINENRPCPAHYLIQKFGDDVADVITALKKDGVIVGRRGRNGGIALPDSVFDKKDNNIMKKIEATPLQTVADIANDIIADSKPLMMDENTVSDLEEAPF